MENGWPMKFSSALRSPSSLVASSVAATAVPIQPHESWNQMNFNMGHCVLPHDSKEPRLMSPELKPTPTFSNMLNFGSSKSAHSEIGNSFLSLLSGPPSLLQYDIQQQSTLKSSNSSYYYAASSGMCDASTISNWPLLHNNGNSSPRPAINVHSVFPSTSIMNTNKYSSHSQCDDLDPLRGLITRASSRNENGSNNSLGKGLYCVPSSCADGEISYGSSINAALEASLQTSSPVAKKRTSVVSDCPRVFCMGACGDLLLSNTGLLGILCSCHGLHMSISNFCEHSGLSDVNPGYAVRMDSGESIAQWRKLYLQKFGIRAPEDHRGWDWTEGLLPTSGLAKSRMAVADRSKVFDLSSLFTSSAESVKSGQPWTNVFAKKPQPDYANQMSKAKEWEASGHRSFPMSFTGSWRRNSHTMPDNPVIPSPTPGSLMASRQSGEGGSRDDCQSRSLHFNIMSTNENSFSSAFQNSQNVGSKTHTSLKDDIVLQRGTLSSSIELKLGQPSQQGWDSGSAALSAMRSNIRGFQTTSLREQLTHNLGSSKVTEHGAQHLHCHAASDLRRTKEQCQSDLLNNVPSTAYGASGVEHLKDVLSNSSVVSVPIPPKTSAVEGSMHHKENNNRINDRHQFFPRTLHSQPRVDKSAAMDVPCHGSDGPIRPSSLNKLAVEKNVNSTVNARPGDNYSSFGTESNFRLYAKQMESSGFFTRHGKACHPNKCTVPGEECNSLRMTSTPPDISFASNYMGSVCSLKSCPDPGHVNSPLRFGRTPTMHTSSSGFTQLTMVRESGNDSASPNKDVAVNPHNSDESLRVLTLRNVEQSFKGKPADASLELNKNLRAHSELLQNKNCNISNLKVQRSFQDPGLSEGRHEHPFTFRHNATPTLLPDIGGMKGGNVTKSTIAEGTNSWEDLGTSICGMSFSSEKTDKYNQGPCVPQLGEQPSLRVGKISDCSMTQRCCGGSYMHVSGRCHCTVQTICSNRERNSKGTSSVNGIKKPIRIGVDIAPPINGARLAIDSSGESNQKVKDQIHGQLDCLDSQWRDVPSKMNPASKLRCPVLSDKFMDKSGEAESHLSQLGDRCISTLEQVAELKGKDLSGFSSGCSAPAVTQASIEVNKIDTCTVDAGDTGYDNHQIADQGSAVDRSWSSGDATDSVRSSQDVCCGKGRSTKEQSLGVFSDVVRPGITDESKQKHSKSQEKPNLSSGEVYNTTQNYENGSKLWKRQMKWKTLNTSPGVSNVSLLPSESPLLISDAADLDNNAFEDVQVDLQSKQGSSTMRDDVDSKDRGFKRRRSGLSSVKLLSRKRDLNGIYKIVEGKTGDQRSLNGKDESVAISENVALKRLKQVTPAGSVMKQVKSAKSAKQFWIADPASDEAPMCSLNCCQKAALVGEKNVWSRKAKPVASGKYGIICDQELDLDQLKPPKIVPLSQVLKSSKRLTKIKNQPSLPSERYVVRSRSGSRCVAGSVSSSTGEGIQCNMVLTCKRVDHETSVHETLQLYHKEEETSANNPSVLGQVGTSGSKRNFSVSSCHPTAQSKPKEIRMRCLYELSMRECELEGRASEDFEKIDGRCGAGSRRSIEKPSCNSIVSELDALCCVCGISNRDKTNCLLECGHCSIRIHQACYGVSRVPKGNWYCRPCRTNSKDVACVLCGYGGGAMTRAFGSRNVVKSLLKAWNIGKESCTMRLGSAEALNVPPKTECENKWAYILQPSSLTKPVVHNSIIGGLYNPTVKQWVHMVCGLWTPGTRCPNVDTMSAFDVSSVSHPKAHMVCYICKRRGGSCIKCRVESCCTYFHPWCAHQKGLLQIEVDGLDNYEAGYYGRCLLHANCQPCAVESDNDTDKIGSETELEKEPTCARTEGYNGKKQEGGRHISYRHAGKGGCLVPQVQLDAWLYINRQKLKMKRLPIPPVSDVDHDYRKEYARYKQAKGWKHLVVYKSGIHALGLYTSQFFPRGAMVVEYIGEIVGLRVADKRESEYLFGRRLQYKSACYFFRIDKEHIIDATCKGGIARFVNHSCEPNCVAKVITVRSEKKVVFFAQRDIYPGEEITYDYHFNHEDEGKKIPCFCNSKNCRRYLN